MNLVILVGRLVRDPELRVLAGGRSVATFTVATDDAAEDGTQYHPVVVWDRLGELAATYLSKKDEVAVRGRLVTRSWDDERHIRHWKTEVVADEIRPSGARSKDFEAALTPA